MPDINMDRLTEALKRDEGYRRSAYEDSEGLLTIGIGRMIDQTHDGGVTEAEAQYLLTNDLVSVFTDLDRNASWWRQMPALGQEALANMCFNLGWPRLSKFQNMLSALEEGDFDKAANEALDSRWATQVGARAERIAELFRTCEQEEEAA